MIRFVALTLAAATAACGGRSPSSSPAAPSPAAPAITFSTHQSAHFTFVETRGWAAFVRTFVR